MSTLTLWIAEAVEWAKRLEKDNADLKAANQAWAKAYENVQPWDIAALESRIKILEQENASLDKARMKFRDQRDEARKELNEAKVLIAQRAQEAQAKPMMRFKMQDDGNWTVVQESPDLERLSKRCKSLDEKNFKALARVSELEGEVARLKAGLDSASLEITVADMAISNWKTTVDGLNNKLAQANKSIGEWQEIAGGKSVQIMVLEGREKNLQISLDHARAAMTDMDNAYRAQVEVAREQRRNADELREMVVALEGNAAARESKIDTLESIVKAQGDAVTHMRRTIDMMDARVRRAT